MLLSKNKNKETDILNGSAWRNIPKFALPLAATGILGQLFNASDIAIVGNFTGSNGTTAVAAVGANSPLIGLIVNLLIGISLGANVVIANAVGQNDDRNGVQNRSYFRAYFNYMRNRRYARRRTCFKCGFYRF